MKKTNRRSFENTVTNDEISESTEYSSVDIDLKPNDVESEINKKPDRIITSDSEYNSFSDEDEINDETDLAEEGLGDDDLDTLLDDIAPPTQVYPKPKVTTLDDINDKFEDTKLSDKERISQIMAKNINMPPCKLDKKLDEKLKNIMTLATIPFILTSIGLSLFNIGKVRHSLSFLFLSLGLAVMTIFYAIRCKNAKKCNCPVCETQARTTLQFSLLWGVMSIGLLIAYIVYAVI